MTLGRLPGRGRLPAILLMITVLAGCGMPRVIVLHDPLTAEEHWRLGLAYQSEGNTQGAMEEYRAGLKRDKNDPRLWTSIGHLHQILGDDSEAIQAYRRALTIDQDSALAGNNLAWLYAHRSERLSEAEILVRRALAADPGHRAFYLDTLAYVHLKLGRLEEAHRTLDEARKAMAPTQRDQIEPQIAITQSLIDQAQRSANAP